MIDSQEINLIVSTYLQETPIENQKKNFAMCLIDEVDYSTHYIVINVAKSKVIARTFSKSHAIDIARIENGDVRAHKVKFYVNFYDPNHQLN